MNDNDRDLAAAATFSLWSTTTIRRPTFSSHQIAVRSETFFMVVKQEEA